MNFPRRIVYNEYMKNKHDVLALVGFIILSEAAGVIGALFTTPAIPVWYESLLKPTLAPPNWVIAPVWTALFFLMGIAAFLVWRKAAGSRGTVALRIFFAQLVINVLWTIIFFGLKNLGGAFAAIVVLWLAIAATIALFARVSKPAAWLLAPYIAWVTFAGYLNLMLWLLNR